jgi:amino acid transporter
MARREAAAETGARSGLRSTLTAPMIVFIVVAAAAPLASMVGNLPVAIAFGNGAGVPAVFLLITLVLLCFAVGYACMSRRVVNTGAFYTYVGLGLGRPAGNQAKVWSFTVKR